MLGPWGGLEVPAPLLGPPQDLLIPLLPLSSPVASRLLQRDRSRGPR